MLSPPLSMAYMAELLLISYPFLPFSSLRITESWLVFITKKQPPTPKNRKMSYVLKNPGDLCFALKYNFFWYFHSGEQKMSRWTTGFPYTQGGDPINGQPFPVIQWLGSVMQQQQHKSLNLKQVEPIFANRENLKSTYEARTLINGLMG